MIKGGNAPTIIRVRRGLNGCRYSACSNDGNIICNFEKLSDVRRHWKWEIRNGLVVLVRELDREPDLSKLNAMSAVARSILAAYGYSPRDDRDSRPL